MSIENEIRKILDEAKEAKLHTPVSEEVEISDDELLEGFDAIDELSKETLGNYIDKASFQYAKGTTQSGKKYGSADSKAKTAKRLSGLIQAKSKYSDKKEQVEAILVELEDDAIIEDILAIDELSKKTLGSYIKKASFDAAENAYRSNDTSALTGSRDGRVKSGIKTIKRIKNIAKATDKLTKEQVEVIESILGELEDESILEDKKEIMVATKKETTIEVDVAEDVAALINGEDLTEEFKTKAATIFETAVVTRVKEHAATLEESFKIKLDEEVKSITEGLIEKVDGYLSYIVEKWISDNEVALTHGIKIEAMENFLKGMKGIFEENYIDIPEEKFDVLGQMESRLQEIETKLEESEAAKTELTTTLNEIKRVTIISEAAQGLSDVQVEKFKQLAEELTFEEEKSFAEKLTVIRENYFKSQKKEVSTNFITESAIEEVEATKSVDPVMSMYLKQLKKAK